MKANEETKDWISSRWTSPEKSRDIDLKCRCQFKFYTEIYQLSFFRRLFTLFMLGSLVQVLYFQCPFGSNVHDR